MPEHRHARAAAQKRAHIAATNFRAQFARALAHYPAPRRAGKTLDLVCSGLGILGHASLANFHVRVGASSILSDLMLRQYDRARADPKIRHFLFTGTFDDGITFEHNPEVDLYRMELKVRRLLRSLGLNGVCVIEVDVLAKTLPGEPARLLLFHVHAVCWTRDPEFAPVAVGRELSALPRFHNRLGLPGISFVSRAMSAAKHRLQCAPGETEDPRFTDDGRGQNAWSMADLGRYVLKAPTSAKDRFQRRNGSWSVCADAAAFGLNTALRFGEIWSQLTPADAVFGVGSEGGALAREFSRRTRRRATGYSMHRQQTLDRDEVACAWQALFDANSKLGFTPARIKRRER